MLRDRFVLTIGALSPAAAQAQGFGDYPVIYRPAAGAKDLRAVLFNWTWYMGMLRGVDEHELIASLKLTRKGNQILYEVTVDDPESLVEPWLMTPRTLTLSTFPDAGLLRERGNCEVYELKSITSQIRH